MVEFDYFTNNDTVSTPGELKQKRQAEIYRNEIELAFFVVELGLSCTEFRTLTETEKLFMRKQYEMKTVSYFIHLRNAVYNAAANVLRKKGSPFVDLFKKKQAKVDKAFTEYSLKIIKQQEHKNNHDWIDLIYQANGLTNPTNRKEV